MRRIQDTRPESLTNTELSLQPSDVAAAIEVRNRTNRTYYEDEDVTTWQKATEGGGGNNSLRAWAYLTDASQRSAFVVDNPRHLLLDKAPSRVTDAVNDLTSSPGLIGKFYSLCVDELAMILHSVPANSKKRPTKNYSQVMSNVIPLAQSLLKLVSVNMTVESAPTNEKVYNIAHNYIQTLLSPNVVRQLSDFYVKLWLNKGDSLSDSERASMRQMIKGTNIDAYVGEDQRGLLSTYLLDKKTFLEMVCWYRHFITLPSLFDSYYNDYQRPFMWLFCQRIRDYVQQSSDNSNTAKLTRVTYVDDIRCPTAAGSAVVEAFQDGTRYAALLTPFDISSGGTNGFVMWNGIDMSKLTFKAMNGAQKVVNCVSTNGDGVKCVGVFPVMVAPYDAVVNGYTTDPNSSLYGPMMVPGTSRFLRYRISLNLRSTLDSDGKLIEPTGVFVRYMKCHSLDRDASGVVNAWAIDSPVCSVAVIPKSYSTYSCQVTGSHCVPGNTVPGVLVMVYATYSNDSVLIFTPPEVTVDLEERFSPNEGTGVRDPMSFFFDERGKFYRADRLTVCELVAQDCGFVENPYGVSPYGLISALNRRYPFALGMLMRYANVVWPSANVRNVKQLSSVLRDDFVRTRFLEFILGMQGIFRDVGEPLM